MEFFLFAFILSNSNSKIFGLRAAEITLENSQGLETIAETLLYNETSWKNFTTIWETTTEVPLTAEPFVKLNSTANAIKTVDLAPKTPTNTFNHTNETSKSTHPMSSNLVTSFKTPQHAEAPVIATDSALEVLTNVLNSTRESPGTQNITPETLDSKTTPTKSTLHQATLTGINHTAHHPMKKNHTALQNTTISKKKQKQPKTTSIPRSTSPQTKLTRVSFNYTRYDWAVNRSEPTTREIDYRESSEFIHESFKKFMLRTRVFVDKSLMIQEFLDHPNQVISITRPRFWGKSMNLNMLRKFFEVEVDPQGTPKAEQDRINRQIFCGGQIHVNESTTKTLDALKIASIPSAMDWQGRYPVIQLNYNFIRNGTYEEITSCMKYQVVRSFKKHFYLKVNFKSIANLLSPSQHSEFERYSTGNLTIDDLTHSLRFLSELLYKYFERKVFILIDDYDTPLIEAFRLAPDYCQNLDRVLQFYREFYNNGFKDNPYLAKGFLTGKLRIANSNLFVNLDNIVEYTLLDHQFTQFYGFTEQEVDGLLANVSKTVSYNVKMFYKGYNYGDQIMYNPWCIKQCIENNYKKGHYWVRSGILMPGNKKMYSLEGLQQHFKSLLSGGSVQIPIKKEVSFEDLADARNFFNFILFTGYLNPVAKFQNGTYQLMNPNPETNLFYQTMLGSWMDEHHKKFGRFGITLPMARNFTSTVSSSNLAWLTNSQKMPLSGEVNETTSTTDNIHLAHSTPTSTSSTWFEIKTNSTTTRAS